MKKRKKTVYAIMVIIFAFDIFFICCCLYIFKRYKELFEENLIYSKPYYFLVYIFSFVLFILVSNIISGMIIYKCAHEESHSEYEEYLLRELYGTKEGIEEGRNIEDKNKSVIASMIDSHKEIKEYFEISKKQEKISYGISIGCAVAGVVMLIVSIFAVFMNIGIETTAITIASGAITEVVSGIVLWIHNKSAMQLNYYYDALHENEKFLSAINLADKLEKKEKEQMYMKIIKAQIRANGKKKDGEK